MERTGRPGARAGRTALMVRAAMGAGGCLALVFSAGFVSQQAWAVAMWPLADTPLTFALLGAMGAAIAASSLWVGYSGQIGVGAVGALDLAVLLGGASASAMRLDAAHGDHRLAVHALAWLTIAVGMCLTFWFLRRVDVANEQSAPRVVRLSFVAFAMVLSVVGVALLVQAPNVLPWRVSGDSSSILAWIFLGAAAFFLYGAARGTWQEAQGQLIGFLAYDAVLVWPLLSRVGTTPAEQKTSLWIYLGILTYSALLAIWSLWAWLHVSQRPVPRETSTQSRTIGDH